jgi:type VI secretion system protein VasD
MLNPDAEGHSLHTVVRVLQLEELTRLRAIRTPAELLLNPREALGDDLLGPPQDLTLAPGERLSRWFARDPKARFVVVVGMFFQSPAGAPWWSAYEFQPVRASRCPEGAQVAQERIPGEGDARPRFRLEGYRIEAAHSREWRP